MGITTSKTTFIMICDVLLVLSDIISKIQKKINN